jgi:hypothetical protein
MFASAEELAPIVARDLSQVAEAGRKPTRGDTRCIIFGHLTRMAVWNLRKDWDRALPTGKRLERFAQEVTKLSDHEQLLQHLASGKAESVPAGTLFSVADSQERMRDAVAF